MSELCLLPAIELAQLIRNREVSALEVMLAHLGQINKVNPELNAIITLAEPSALNGARHADTILSKGGHLGPLHGLPVAHKDTVLTQGIRTTY